VQGTDVARTQRKENQSRISAGERGSVDEKKIMQDSRWELVEKEKEDFMTEEAETKKSRQNTWAKRNSEEREKTNAYGKQGNRALHSSKNTWGEKKVRDHGRGVPQASPDRIGTIENVGARQVVKDRKKSSN